MGEGIIVQPAEKWRVLKGNILQCWESNERSKWSSIEKPLWKEGGEFGFYVAVRIWDLFSFYSDKTLLGCVFFSSIQTVYTMCYFKLPYVYIIMSFEKKLCFFSFCYLGVFKTEPLFVRHTHSPIYVLMWIHFPVNVNTIFPARLRNKWDNSRILLRDSIRSLYWLQCINTVILKIYITS